MKSVIFLFILLIASTPVFSQNVTVNKKYLDKTIEELRTKDLLAERVTLQDSLITGLEEQVTILNRQKALNAQYYQSCLTENAANVTKVQNLEGLYKLERAKKRRKGVWNFILTGALGTAGYLYLTR